MERRSGIWRGIGSYALLLVASTPAFAESPAPILTDERLDVRGLLEAGGAIGYIILALSVAMVALVVEHVLSIRRSSLMPPGLADETQQLIAAGQFPQAEQRCREQPSFLGYMLIAGLQEAGVGYDAVEKGMEDAAVAQSARLYRKIEYLSVIGTIAPMLGLLGTVWGMIQAFGEFSDKANPQVSEFAPGISHALVTTLFGLCVAIPSLAAFAALRNRIDEYVAETSLAAEHVMAPLKRTLKERRRVMRESRPGELRAAERTPPSPVAREREAPR
jgi:biopolymer transport protein ExbB